MAGLALPGDFVDVILIQNFDKTEPGQRTSGETVLRDVRVLAVDQAMSAPSGVGTAIGTEPASPGPSRSR